MNKSPSDRQTELSDLGKENDVDVELRRRRLRNFVCV